MVVASDAAYSCPAKACPTLGKNAKRGCLTRMPSTSSSAGTLASRPAADQRRNALAPGNQGIVPRISTVHRRERAENCWRLNGADDGSTLLGKILVIIRTFMAHANA